MPLKSARTTSPNPTTAWLSEGASKRNPISIANAIRAPSAVAANASHVSRVITKPPTRALAKAESKIALGEGLGEIANRGVGPGWQNSVDRQDRRKHGQADEVEDERDRPHANQRRGAPSTAEHGSDGNQEVLREQLRAADGHENQRDAEEQRTDHVRQIGVRHAQHRPGDDSHGGQSQHHVESAYEARRRETFGIALEPALALVDGLLPDLARLRVLVVGVWLGLGHLKGAYDRRAPDSLEAGIRGPAWE